jgi:ferredoxin
LEVVKAIFQNVRSPFWSGISDFFNMDYLQPLVLLNMPDTFANGAATQSYNQIFGDKDAYKKNLELLIFAKQNNKFPSWVDVSGAKDFYTQDYFATQLMKIEPNNIVMIRQAIEKNLINPNEIILKGDPIPENLTPFKIPDARKLDFSNVLPGDLGKIFAKICSKIFKSFPKVDKTKCIGCGKCAESCPQKIINIKNKKAHFPRKNCISCFCCQEMCPVKAISVKRWL